MFGIELYNHSGSPVPTSFDMEYRNIAAEPQSQGIVTQLHELLKWQFTAPLPPLGPPPSPPTPGAQPVPGFTVHY